VLQLHQSEHAATSATSAHTPDKAALQKILKKEAAAAEKECKYVSEWGDGAKLSKGKEAKEEKKHTEAA